jgi:uncharacterized protein (DUF2237 family)
MELELDPLAWRGKVDVRGWLLFSKIWGSFSHATQLPGSDVDYTGVYVAYQKDLLGLHPPTDTLTGEKPDYQIHEVKKFCDLLLKGNPGIIEMLFTDRMMWSDPKWKPLYEARKKFLCKTVVKQYLGYSVAQLQRLRHSKPVHSKGGIPGEKWCYHMVRVAWDAERIALGGEPKVWKDGEEKERLMAIRTGAWTTEQAVKEAEETVALIDSRKPWPIPDEADEKFLNDWLLWIRGVNGWEPKEVAGE